MMLMKPQALTSQRADPAEYSKYRRSSRYTLWKGHRVRLCHIFQESWMIKNMYWFSGSTTTLAY